MLGISSCYTCFLENTLGRCFTTGVSVISVWTIKQSSTVWTDKLCAGTVLVWVEAVVYWWMEFLEKLKINKNCGCCVYGKLSGSNLLPTRWATWLWSGFLFSDLSLCFYVSISLYLCLSPLPISMKFITKWVPLNGITLWLRQTININRMIPLTDIKFAWLTLLRPTWLWIP